jgi:hypothetical protein
MMERILFLFPRQHIFQVKHYVFDGWNILIWKKLKGIHFLNVMKTPAVLVNPRRELSGKAEIHKAPFKTLCGWVTWI